jgi:hypothetical protein
LKDASVKDGKLLLKSGMHYSVLVLPQQKTMRPELLKKLKELVNEGLVILGPAPVQSPSLQNYPQCDKEVQEIAQELWQPSNTVYTRCINYGKGRVYPTASLEEIFTDLGIVPDFQSADPCDPLLFIHRQLAEGDAYFVSNQSDKTLNIDAAFRIKGKIPELWNPQTAEVRLLPTYKEMTKATQIPMTLQPYESAFVVFRTPTETLTAGGMENYPAKQSVAKVDGPWTVAFQAGRGGPAQPVVFNELTDWTKNADNSIKYFSGTATYTTSFKVDRLPKDQQIYIDLGKVMVMAKVKVNGNYVGGVWTSPYRLNITSYVKKGKNDLEVEVVNNWMNRLIRDKNLPDNEKITWQTFSYWAPDSPLQTSGLLGPVEIQSYNYKMIP